MSTLAVGTIKSATTSPPTVQNSAGTEIGTFCRAWVNFNGTGTVAIRAGFNVSSITDNGTGDYTANFTVAMGDANYSVCGAGSIDGAGAESYVVPFTYASGSFRFETLNSGDTNQDSLYVNLNVFR